MAMGGAAAQQRDDRWWTPRGGSSEESPGRPYREIVAESLVEVAGLSPAAAAAIGFAAGTWPLFPDSAAALARLQSIAPCAATTNSDRAHGENVQRQLGFRLAHWWCAEEIGCYKPDPNRRGSRGGDDRRRGDEVVRFE
jgi:FMN phosphatase YigB (HAD superfamily)